MSVKYEPASHAQPIELGGPGVVLEAPGTLVVDDHPRPGLATRITLRWEPSALHIAAVEVESTHPEEVSTNDMRSVRVIDLVKTHLQDFVSVHSLGWSFPASDDLAEAVRKTWPTMTAVSTVAQTYNFARALRMPPIKAVVDSYGISRATAHRWIDTCRERGEILDG